MSAVMDKIKALLVMAERGATENERMIAAEKAQRLMIEHEISLLEAREPVEDFETEFEEWDGMANHWKINLMSVIANATGVHLHRAKIRSGKGPSRIVRATLIGRPDKIEFVRSLNDSLSVFLEHECEKALQIAIRDQTITLKPRAFRTCFFIAAVNRIDKRLQEQRRDIEEEIGTGMELVRRDDQALRDFVNERHQLKNQVQRYNLDPEANRAGHEAGSRANTRPGQNLPIGQKALTA